MKKGGFERIVGSPKVIWPGGTTKLPQDKLRSGDPAQLSIGWIIESSWGTPALWQESRMYAQQAIDEVNDNLFLLPNTHLTLEEDSSVNGNDVTVKAHNAVEARAKAAGRPLAAVMACSSSHMTSIYAPQANATVTQPSTGIPIIGYFTGAGVLSDSKRFPNFVRLYPPVSEVQHILRKMALRFGWTRVGLICDNTDSYSTSFFDLMNGTDPTNPSNLQPPIQKAGGGLGPYDKPRLDIVHAERIDMGKDTNATKDTLIAAIKAKDIKVFILFGQTAFIDGLVLYGLDRGTFSPGFQFIIPNVPYPNMMNSRTRAALDGLLRVTAAGVAPEYPGLQRASTFWSGHPPTQPPVGTNTSTPFRVSGRKPRFQDASLYDSIMLAATAIDACLKEGCRPVGNGFKEVMPYFRAASIEGIAGPTSIKAGSNDPAGRLFSVKVGKNPASRGVGTVGPYTFKEVTVTSTVMPDLQVCVDPKLGGMCNSTAAAPGTVKCFASSASAIDVEWEAAQRQGESGLLTGYRVTAFALNQQVFASVNSTAENRVTFAVEATNPDLRLKHNLVYSVQVEALYDKATVRSKAATCQVPQNGLPCIPPPPLSSSTSASIVSSSSTAMELGGLLVNGGEQSPTCGCKSTEFHTKGLPVDKADPQLQLDGSLGAPAKDWRCETCPEGVQCNGGTAATIVAAPGWFAIRSVSATTGAEKRPKLWRCPGGVAACPGGASITKAMGVLPSTTAMPAERACNAIMNTSADMMPREYDTTRLSQYPQCQCGRGGTGMLCRTCQSWFATGEKDWVIAASGNGCTQCSVRSSDATSIVGITVFGFLLIVILGVLGWWRYTRPSKTEQRFVKAFSRITELGAEAIVEKFFGVSIGSGITKVVFLNAVALRCGRAGEIGVTAASIRLWNKLDEDGDGQVDLDEFVSFVCDLRDGKKKDAVQNEYGKVCIEWGGGWLEWWRSMKMQTLRAVIIAHFQLQSSIEGSFPEMHVVPVNEAVNTTSNSTDVPTFIFKRALNEASGYVSNMNVVRLIDQIKQQYILVPISIQQKTVLRALGCFCTNT